MAYHQTGRDSYRAKDVLTTGQRLYVRAIVKGDLFHFIRTTHETYMDGEMDTPSIEFVRQLVRRGFLQTEDKEYGEVVYTATQKAVEMVREWSGAKKR